MECLFASLTVQWRPHARGTPLSDTACFLVESPKSDAQTLESFQESSGSFGCLHWEHKQGPVGEVAIAESLLQALPPIRYFALDGRETDTLLERQSCEFVGRSTRFPCQPHEVSTTETFNGELTSSHSGTDFLREISPLKTAKKTAFLSLDCNSPEKIPLGILGSKSHEHRASHSGLIFHGRDHLGEDTKIRRRFNVFQDAQRFFETLEIPQPVAVKSAALEIPEREGR